MTSQEKIQSVVERLRQEFAEFKPELQEVIAEIKSGEIIKAILGTREIIAGMLEVAEQAAEAVGGLTRQELRTAVITAANEIVNIPWVPEYAEGVFIGKIYDWVAGKFDSTQLDEKSMAVGKVVLERLKVAIALPDTTSP